MGIVLILLVICFIMYILQIAFKIPIFHYKPKLVDYKKSTPNKVSEIQFMIKTTFLGRLINRESVASIVYKKENGIWIDKEDGETIRGDSYPFGKNDLDIFEYRILNNKITI